MQKQHTYYIYWTNFHHSAKEQKYRQNLIQEYLDLYLLCTWDYACILICLRDALDNSGYKHKLKYKANLDTVSNKKQQKRNIIWINPLYSKNVKTNKGKIFLNLIKKHFPPHHKFHKLFNKKKLYLHVKYQNHNKFPKCKDFIPWKKYWTKNMQLLKKS